jgi:hypothetical protein
MNRNIVRYLKDVVLEKYLADTRKVRFGKADGTYESPRGTMDSQAWFTTHPNSQAE